MTNDDPDERPAVLTDHDIHGAAAKALGAAQARANKAEARVAELVAVLDAYAIRDAAEDACKCGQRDCGQGENYRDGHFASCGVLSAHRALAHALRAAEVLRDAGGSR